MKRTLGKVLAALMLCATGSLGFAGPFGLEMGTSLADLERLCGAPPREIAPGFYSVKPPSPHPDFDSYVVQVSPRYGTHFIKAIGRRVETPGDGSALREAFSDVVTGLEKTYGKGEALDYLQKGSAWPGADNWMISLLKKERVLLAFWKERKNAAYPGNVASIGAMAVADSTGSGFVMVEYYSGDNELAQAANDADSVF